jgi:Cdc6-like AAA superfamily ATPase
MALSIAHPEKLIDRNSQLAELKDFFVEALANRRNSKKSVYISGPPGTGKTTCVKYLLETLLPDLDPSVRDFNLERD